MPSRAATSAVGSCRAGSTRSGWPSTPGTGPSSWSSSSNATCNRAGLTAGFGGRIALVDGLIHQQDIRRPLGIGRDIPGDRLRPVLDFARTAPPIGAFRRIRGLRLVATDLDWAMGKGAEVTGTGEALLMAMAGRGDAVGELAGPGSPCWQAG